MKDPSVGIGDRSKRYLRNHPEVVMFGLGVLLFAAGLLTVFATRPDPRASSQTNYSTAATSNAAPARSGPQGREPIGSYIDRKRALLLQSAGLEPRKVVQAIISFDSYRKVGDVANFIKLNRLEVVVVHIRIPLGIFEPVEVSALDRSVTETAADAIGPQRIADLRAELKELESLLKDVIDPEFKAVYREDAESHRKAIALLTTDPAVIFAVVVKASLGQLRQVASAKGVRLVDLSDAGPAPPVFAGILPEQL